MTSLNDNSPEKLENIITREAYNRSLIVYAAANMAARELLRINPSLINSFMENVVKPAEEAVKSIAKNVIDSSIMSEPVTKEIVPQANVIPIDLAQESRVSEAMASVESARQEAA